MIQQADVRYIVIRVHPDILMHHPYLNDEHGKWINRPLPLPHNNPPDMPLGNIWTATATGRYERREDGALAEVYEVNP